ncbi:MAG: DNA gyrase subunit A, partial [bacterium]
DKETVEFGPNYDETETQPLALPTRVPNLLVNGSAGIAVGMATNVPPHNLSETVAATLALIRDPDITVAGLMQHLPGPDFPTAGIINGRGGIRQAYETGRGRIYVRARVEIEQAKNGREAIVVHELPYQVNKARLLSVVAELVKAKRLDGIAALRDESDKSGMRMVIELKRGEQSEVTLNNLYKHTKMQTVFGINMVALGKNQPRLFNLKEALEEFVKHRREVVTRRALFDLRRARERAHILEGLAVALANIDAIIAAIKAAPTPARAKSDLLAARWDSGDAGAMLARAGADLTRPHDLGEPDDGGDPYGAAESESEGARRYRLSPTQAQAILDLRLHRLTGLEQEKIRDEYAALIERINDLLRILRDPDRLMQVISDELEEVQQKFGDPRRTEIIDGEIDLSMEDLIPEEDLVVTLSHAGYAKSQPVADYSAQRRGGKGRIATRTKDEDFVGRMFVAHSHDTILCFSDRGKVYWLRVFQLPQAGRQARGKPLVNLLPLDDGEQITAILPIKEYTAGRHVLMATARGVVKKCRLTDFSRPLRCGIRAVNLRDDDHLIGVALTDGDADVLLVSDAGKAMRFAETDVRTMGRTAAGVRGIRLEAGQRVIALLAVPATSDGDDTVNSVNGNAVLISTENGYGKRTPTPDFPRKRRGGKGVIAIKTSQRNGAVVSALLAGDNDEVMLVTAGGMLVRTPVGQISMVGRNTQGVRLISLKESQRLVSVSKLEDAGQPPDGDGGDDTNGADDIDDSNDANGDDDAPTTVH